MRRAARPARSASRRSAGAARGHSDRTARPWRGASRVALRRPPCDIARMPERVVIVGAGQAGAQVAVSLRQLGYGGEITLLGEERQPPYQRPPLSKAYLSGEMALERTWLRSESYYAKHAINLRLGVRVARILRDERAVVCDDGARLDYDALALCTGTRARKLSVPGVDLPGVLYLRT